MCFKTSRRTRWSSRLTKMWTKRQEQACSSRQKKAYLFIISVVLGLEPGAPHMLGKHPATKLLESKIFSKRDRSCENRRDVGSARLEIRPKSNEMTTRCPSHLQMRKGVLRPRWGCRRHVLWEGTVCSCEKWFACKGSPLLGATTQQPP